MNRFLLYCTLGLWIITSLRSQIRHDVKKKHNDHKLKSSSILSQKDRHPGSNKLLNLERCITMYSQMQVHTNSSNLRIFTPYIATVLCTQSYVMLLVQNCWEVTTHPPSFTVAELVFSSLDGESEQLPNNGVGSMVSGNSKSGTRLFKGL